MRRLIENIPQAITEDLNHIQESIEAVKRIEKFLLDNGFKFYRDLQSPVKIGFFYREDIPDGKGNLAWVSFGYEKSQILEDLLDELKGTLFYEVKNNPQTTISPEAGKDTNSGEIS